MGYRSHACHELLLSESLSSCPLDSYQHKMKFYLVSSNLASSHTRKALEYLVQILTPKKNLHDLKLEKC